MKKIEETFLTLKAPIYGTSWKDNKQDTTSVMSMRKEKSSFHVFIRIPMKTVPLNNHLQNMFTGYKNAFRSCK